jgi:ArsR family transcriptional regulator
MAAEDGDKEYLCGVQMIHEDIINIVKSELTEDESLYYMSEFFRMFGDGTRLKIINALMISEMCVCDISALIGMNQSVISHHLKILRDARVINFRREGKIVYYSLCDDHIRLIFNQGLTHIREKGEKH